MTLFGINATLQQRNEKLFFAPNNLNKYYLIFNWIEWTCAAFDRSQLWQKSITMRRLRTRACECGVRGGERVVARSRRTARRRLPNEVKIGISDSERKKRTKCCILIYGCIVALTAAARRIFCTNALQ
jgi:hypothetical protein